MKTVVVTGATSLIGHFLLPRLANAGFQVIAVSRSKGTHWLEGITGVQGDISNPESLRMKEQFSNVQLLIHLAPLWLLPEFLKKFPSSKNLRTIAFSSTSRLSKIDSNNLADRTVAQKLANAEDILLATYASQITIFRPTLIYGAGLDKNISTISQWVTRFKFFPLIGEASGLRQPVHADDLAKACLQVVEKPAAKGNIYNLTGGEVISYRTMVERIFTALKIRSRFVVLPTRMIKVLIRMMSVIPKYKDLTPEMAVRMNKDLMFDATAASQEFGYQARDFHPDKIDIVQ